MALYSGEIQSANGTAGIGIALGTYIRIVVQLNGSFRHYIHNHFQDTGLSGADVESRINGRPKWFGIIGVQQSHEYLMRLWSRDKIWVGFVFVFFCLVSGGQAAQMYQQLARFRNARHD